jgi:hypothetical protein
VDFFLKNASRFHKINNASLIVHLNFPSPRRRCHNHRGARFLSFRPKGEIFKFRYIQNKDFSK